MTYMIVPLELLLLRRKEEGQYDKCKVSQVHSIH